MRKGLLIILAFLFFPLAAQELVPSSVKQSLIPKEIYVGDTAQLSCSFHSDVDFYLLAQRAGAVSKMEGGVLYLDISDGYFNQMEPRCTVSSLSMSQVGTTYTLVLRFIPWRTGSLEFIPLDMARLCHADTGMLVTLEPVQVLSLAKKLGTETLRPVAPPILLPGTNYIVWSIIVLLIVLLVLLAIFAMNFSSAIKRMIIFKEKMGYSYNAFISRRKLRGLLKKDWEADSDFAQGWQLVMRGYLNYRFNCSFFSVTSKDIFKIITEATGDMLDIEQENAVLSVQAAFIRTDYIRYAKDSPDSRKLPAQDHEAAFNPGEKESIVELSLGDIAELEREREEFKDYGRV
ncbi:MAG: hypothetical protein IJU95_10510 [Treponema sp.]|nr:hypothetical protein [Treponema sp.]